MNKVYCTSFHSTIGAVHVASTDRGVCKICIPAQSRKDLQSWLHRHLPGHEIEESDTKNRGIIDELNRYFDHRLVTFHSASHLVGTEFQKKVWKELKKIRYGSTITYKDLARRVGMPDAYQTVGRVNGANPLPILIPCHRVVGKDNRLTGYAGGVKTKEFLLRLEGALLI
ncbi:MAG: methylated-DNA--[protein]-cysteine S-methyltransferase [Ignavibacteriales bacterium]|nr:methylated-DNA--[protein]-cysteine S-methyltransferase [Ignavibacteriales bacterium]